MGLLIIFIGVAIGVSFLCSILEATLLSATRTHLYAVSEKGHKYATRWKQLKEEVDKPLSAILSLNTIANTIGSVSVGSQITILFGSGYLGLSSGIMTFLILVFAEIIPKTLGARYWRFLLPYTGSIIHYLVIFMRPLVWVSQLVAKWISPPKMMKSIYKEELQAMASLAKDEGSFPDSEYRILCNIIYFNQIVVEDIMTPRTVVIAVPDTITLKEIYDNKEIIRFSRVPIFEKTIDNVIGFYLKSDLLNAIIQGQGSTIVKDIARSIYITHELTPASLLFEELISRKEQISLVVDSYGGMSGIATMEDIIETLFGIEIMDELDSMTDMQKYARDKWRERAFKLGIIQKKINNSN